MLPRPRSPTSFGRDHTVESAIGDGQHLFGRPAVIREQKADVGGLHM